MQGEKAGGFDLIFRMSCFEADGTEILIPEKKFELKKLLLGIKFSGRPGRFSRDQAAVRNFKAIAESL